MEGLTPDQIIERIANANGVEPAVMRQQIEQALKNIIADTSLPHSFMLAELFPGSKPTADELVVALECELYDAMMPTFPGWEWDGEGYRNIRLLKKKQ
ncbi:MAG: hypothetical protein J6Q53_03060 [Oscillospiraceae bacterium]|nr:hypothetical protein [Oscillospiraceae bacterium]